ncbi:hypothetical protein FRB99_005515 [Tulasnella sp. 403]|nr:hypothetical protein FRB99_005515 [Tulasnella sp. 403]
MHVLPDVVPAIHPTLDLHVIFERSKTSTAVDRWLDVEPGVFLPSRRTMGPPRIQATVFHPETRLYTLMIVDPDVPDPANKTFQTYLHLLQPNVPLSAQTTFRKNISLKSTPVPYVPPHPQKGTPYHRYVTLLLPQLRPIELKKKDIPRREGFNVRDFVAKYQLGSLSASEAVKMNMVPETYAEKIGGGLGGGIHMWREVWDEDVSQIYKGILKTPEPTYGHPPKPDPYQGQKKNKYF